MLSYSLKIEPSTHFINWQQDPHGNWLARLVFPEKTDRFTVSVDLVADMAVVNPFDFFLEPYAEKWPFDYEAGLLEDLAPFRKPEPAGPLLKAWLAKVDRSEQRTIDFLVGLNQRLQQDIGYIIRMEPGVQTCEQTLGTAKGSCRDSGWLLVQIFAPSGFSPRVFVSGYLIQLVADQKALDGPSGTTHDFTDSARLDGGLSARCGVDRVRSHVRLDDRRRPYSAGGDTPPRNRRPPVEGAHEKAEVKFGHEMYVTRIAESARVTKPYTDEEWAKIEKLGHVVDGHLAKGDVRLTMGGEPTFVSIDDMDGDEWKHRCAGGRRNGASRARCSSACRSYGPPGAFAAFRPRQMVSGRKPAALGLGLLVAARRRADFGAIPRCSPMTA